uniref:Uncharacterized protein n=1 Tax=Bionectria ochroleuca TaxID=29856 RepID=A0A8H7KDW6_BIOOC
MAAAICHNYTLAMQEYMDLQVERDELCNHLEQIRPALSINTGYGSVSSPSASPTRYSLPSPRRAPPAAIPAVASADITEYMLAAVAGTRLPRPWTPSQTKRLSSRSPSRRGASSP